MKISYKVLQSYISDLKTEEEIARDLVMHTAEVEEIIYEGENLKDVYIGEVESCVKHPNSEKLNCTIVKVNGKIIPIVCGAPNVKAGIKVPIAVVGAKLTPDFEIKKTKIRGETSEGMICSEDELGMVEERQTGILELAEDAPLGISMRDYLKKDDAILEIDNKAINHRPDLFSHIGIIREIYAINGEHFNYKYADNDYSDLPDLLIKNEINDNVKRYIGLKIDGVRNIESPDYIKQVLASADVKSKGLLIDISNYTLYLYGQPTHCFDADKIEGNITIRYAKNGETFTALNDNKYELSDKDIVIADEKKVLALGGIIGGKSSCVTNETTNIVVEGAHFDQAKVRKSGKRLGIRTDSLNVFEKDIIPDMAKKGVSLISDELEKNIDTAKTVAYSDSYENKQETVTINFDLNYINNLIGKKYSEIETKNILENLGIKIEGDKLIVPFWRKDLNYKSDIAEEIARINGYNNIKSSIPKIQLGAVLQDNIYKIKNDSRDLFTKIGFYDMYNYSFVCNEIMQKLNSNTNNLVPLKNSLSEDSTHMKGSLIPNLMLSLERNIRNITNMKLFEIEKVFSTSDNKISENYNIAGVITSENDTPYFEMQNVISNYFKTIKIDNYFFDTTNNIPKYAHSGRTASIVIRGKEVGIIGEIHPKVSKNFDLKNRVGFFEINLDKLSNIAYNTTKAKEISSFQASSFDINFVVGKKIKGKDIKSTIEKTNNIIEKVELFDIYENEEKLAGLRSLSFKVFIQKMEATLDDKEKNELITEIIKKVEKKGGKLR